MNKSNLEHVSIAFAIQAAFVLAGLDANAGAAAASFLFIGREHAQAEYRWIETFGQRKRANMPEWGGFDYRVWSKWDSWADWLAPSVAVWVVAWMLA